MEEVVEYVDRTRWQNPAGKKNNNMLSIIHYPYNSKRDDGVEYYSTKAVKKFIDEAEGITLLMGEDDFVFGILDRSYNDLHILVNTDSLEDKEGFISQVIDPIIQDITEPLKNGKVKDIEGIKTFLSRMSNGKEGSIQREINRSLSDIEIHKNEIVKFNESIENSERSIKNIDAFDRDSILRWQSITAKFINDANVRSGHVVIKDIDYECRFNDFMQQDRESFCRSVEAYKIEQRDYLLGSINSNKMAIVGRERSIKRLEESIEKLRKDFEEITKKGSRELDKNLISTVQAFNLMDFVSDVTVNNTGNIEVKTKTIYFQEGKRRYNLGTHTITFGTTDNGRLTIESVIHNERPKHKNPHPHLYENGRRVCWGNLEAWAGKLLSKNDITGITSVLRQLLMNVNLASSYVSILRTFPSEIVEE